MTSDEPGGQASAVAAAVLTPTGGVDPRDALATSMFAARGVYAVLVGSGMSTAAGVLTGARIVEDLVRLIARQRGVPQARYDEEPMHWWAQETGKEARYDALLAALATTDAARQALLSRYFEIRSDTGLAVEPTAAHHALAKLCTGGYVRVLITTNFDSLIEQALDAAGVACQVLVGEDVIRARIPLAHASVTLVKLHGDYRSTGLKNSPEELAVYGPAQKSLLQQIFDEYGLVAIGWSAEWDRALVESIEATIGRRYPMYWVSYRGAVAPTAEHLIINRQASPISSQGADEFLPDLVQRVDRLAERSRRGAAPAFRRAYVNQPQDGLSNNWTAVPWLVLRTFAATVSVNADSLGLIGPEIRERIVSALRRLPAIGQMIAWNSRTPLDATPPQRRADGVIDTSTQAPTPAPSRLDVWTPIPGLQSANRVAYRLGGDGRVGTSAVATIRMPDLLYGEVFYILDIGISLDQRLSVLELVTVLRDGLVLVTSDLPDAVADLLPLTKTPVRCEVHLLAPRSDGHGQSRENGIGQRLDLDVFSTNSADHVDSAQASWGYGAEISSALTKSDAGELIQAGVNYLALTAGFLDPRRAITQIRGVLGLAAR